MRAIGMDKALVMAVLFATLKLVPLGKRRNELLGILCSVRDITQNVPGCLGCWLDDGGYVRGPVSYVEEWESEDGLRQHLSSDLFRRLLVAMELASEPPEIHFHTVAESRGMELIEEARGVSRTKPTAQEVLHDY